jgi:hypothetical protein
MTARRASAGFAARPGAAEAWIAAEVAPPPIPPASTNSARLTIDITPALRGRIKIAAFQRGQTMTDMVREMLHQAFPEGDGGGS